MELRFKYVRDKLCKRLSLVYVILIASVFTAIFFLVADGYLRAWLYSFALAVIALYILSIPRYVSVDGDKLEIRCVVELTRVEICDIASIRKTSRDDYKRTFPLLGSFGFFGYYGYYLDLRRWDIIKVYLAERAHYVEITDIFEQVFVISCRDADRLIDAVEQARKQSRTA